MQRGPHQRRQHDGAGRPRETIPTSRDRESRARTIPPMTGAATQNAITRSHSAPSARADFSTSPMNPGSTSRPVARDTRSHPMTSTTSATTPIRKLHPRGPAQREIIGKRRARQADRDPQRGEHGRQSHDHGERNRQAAADDMDRGGNIDRPFPPQHEPGHDRDLSDKHRGEDEQAPQRGAPEFPDAGRPPGGNDRQPGCRRATFVMTGLSGHPSSRLLADVMPDKPIDDFTAAPAPADP